MGTPKFVFIGHVCIDHNMSEHTTYKGWGSSVFYMANYLTQTYGLAPSVIASHGPDILPYAPAVTLLPAQPSAHTTLIYENDSRSGKRVQHCRNIAEATPPALDQELRHAIKTADVIVVAPLLDNYEPEYVRDLLAHTAPGTLKALCPQGYFRHVAADGRVSFQDSAALDKIVPLFDLVFYSEEDHPKALELAKTWAEHSDVQIVVTKGAAGANVTVKDSTLDIPTTPIPLEQVVDSVGCGDVFAASCIYEYYQSRDLAAAIGISHKAAAKKLLSTPVA